MMSIAQCPACQAQIRLNDGQDGTRVRCPRCQEAFVAEAIPVAPLARPGDPPPRRAAPPPLRKSNPEHHKYDEPDEVVEVDRATEVRSRRGMVTRTKAALILMFVGQCCTLVALIFAALFLVLVWARTGPTESRVEIIGLPGLLGWIVSLIGVGFAVSGLQKQNAIIYSIALAAVATVHLILLAYLVMADDRLSIPNVAPPAPRANLLTGVPLPAQPQIQMPRMAFGPAMPMHYFATALPFSYASFGMFANQLHRRAINAISFTYSTEIVRYGFVPILIGVVEVARWILLALWLRELRVLRVPLTRTRRLFRSP